MASTWKTSEIENETGVCRKLDLRYCDFGTTKFYKKLTQWSRLSGQLYRTRLLYPIPTPTLPLKGREIAQMEALITQEQPFDNAGI